MVSPGFVRNVDRAKSKKVVSTFSHQPLSPGSYIPPESQEIGSQDLSPASRQLLNDLYGPDWDAPSVPVVGTIGPSVSSRSTRSGPQTSTVSGAGVIGSSKSKKTRGKTKGYKLNKIREEGHRFEVIFPAHTNMPVGEYSTLFTTEIGVLVRQIAPLQVRSWGDVSCEIKDSIINRLRDKFIFSHDSQVVQSVESMMARRYHTWRHNIRKKFWKFKTIAAAVSNPPPFNISVSDWMYLCNSFSTEKFKARSETNKRNKEKLTTTHCAGTKAFSKIRYEERDTTMQMDLGLVELYEATHKRKDGSWVHENAKKYSECLKEHKANAELAGTVITDEKLSVMTFGRKSGYICGLGRGPKPALSTIGRRTRAELERENNESKKRAELAERSAMDARKETAMLAEKMKILEANQAEQAEKMNAQFLLVQQLFGTSMGQNDL